MGISKIVYGERTLLDLTGDTVTAETMMQGVTAHGADGEIITGTMSGGGASGKITLSESTPTASDGAVGDVWIVGSGGMVDSRNVTFELSTNYSTGSGDLDNVTDGDSSTYWRSSNTQSTGYYVMATFTSPVTLTKVELYCGSSSYYPRSSNVLQVSEDGSNWSQIGTFSGSTTSTFTGEWENVKAVRVYCASSSGGGGSSRRYLQINTLTLEWGSGLFWDYHFTAVYQKTVSGWAETDSLDALSSGTWTF